MSMTKDQLEYVIKRSKTEKVDPIPRDSLDVIPDGNRGTLFVSEYWPRRNYFYL